MGMPPYFLVVVRAGETELFEALREQLATAPYPAALMWDRRRRDRRVIVQDVPEERRAGDRRALAYPEWDRQGFLVTETLALPPDAITNRRAALAPRTDPRVLPFVRDPGAGRIRRTWERGERIVALRMFTSKLERGLHAMSAIGGVTADDQAERPTVVLA
jgi:hypothetical protein